MVRNEEVDVGERWYGRIVAVEPDERAALGWSFAYFFCILAAWYILQPLRDALGLAAGGTRSLPWLFQGSLVVMLVANGAFSAVVARYERRHFIPGVYRFFQLNLLGFWVVLVGGSAALRVHMARLFFLWAGVFNLFVVSVFWAFMADRFSSAQGKRLFGFIGAGGTLGQVVGSAMTAVLAERLGTETMILVALVLLEGAVVCVGRLTAEAAATEGPRAAAGAVTDGVLSVLRSPYLLGICLYIFLYTFTSSFLYFAKMAVAEASFAGSAERTAFFGTVNLWVGVLTFVVQFFFTGRIVGAVGLAAALALVPAVTALGFAGVGGYPVLGALVVFEVVRKSANYAIARPAREILFTVVGRREKYAAKNFIDTFVYRAGDGVAAAAFGAVQTVTTGVAATSFAAVPFALVWMASGLWLGRRQALLAPPDCP